MASKKKATATAEPKVQKFTVPQGTALTPKGVLPPDQLRRHKMSKVTNRIDCSDEATFVGRKGREFKDWIEMFKQYRLNSFGVTEPRLNNALRIGAHYLYVPLQKTYEGPAPEMESVDGQVVVK